MKHVERAHAILSGSFASIFLNCTGAVQLKESLPPEAASIYAEEGTKAHELAEKVLRDRLIALENGPTGLLESVYDATDEMLDAAEGYADAVVNKALEGFVTGKAWGIEDQFTLHEKFEMYGHIDFWAVYIDDRGARVGVIGDFKYGFGRVDAVNNPQLAYYACALREELRRSDRDLDYVRAFIYQPRGTAEAYSETKFTGKQLDTWTSKFLKVAESVFIKKKFKFKAGKHCKYCKAKSVCKEFNKSLENKTALALVDTQVKFPEPERLSDTQLVNILTHRSAIESYLKSVYAYALARANQGKDLPGMKFVEGQARSKWMDEKVPDLVDSLQAVGVNPYKQELKGITLIEKELKLKKEKLDVRSFTFKPAGKPSLVTTDDPRPALKNLNDLLTEVEEE